MLIAPARSTLLWLLATGALFLTLPSVSFASSVTSSFLTSSTGTSTIEIGDTIQYEVTVTLRRRPYWTATFSVTGDVSGLESLWAPLVSGHT